MRGFQDKMMTEMYTSSWLLMTQVKFNAKFKVKHNPNLSWEFSLVIILHFYIILQNIIFILNSPETLTRLRTKNSLNSGSLSEMASSTIDLVSSPVVKVMEPEVLVNSWFSSKGVTESLANSCQKTVTLPKWPLSRRTLWNRRKYMSIPFNLK